MPTGIKMEKSLGSNNQDFRVLPTLWGDIERKKILDLGCGSGLYVRELSSHGAIPVGIDLKVETLLRNKGEEASVGSRLCHFVCADAEHLPFRDETFDMVLSVEVLTHIPPDVRSRVFSDVHRVMSEGALAFFTLHNSFRLKVGHWLRLRKAKNAYPTNNLTVWPLTPKVARKNLNAARFECDHVIHYLNYHSRFSHSFFVAHPYWSRAVIVIEDVLCRLPFLRRLAITFLVRVRKVPPISEMSIA